MPATRCNAPRTASAPLAELAEAGAEEPFEWLLDLGRRFGPLAEHILTRYHHPRTAEMSIMTANMGNEESRRTANPASAFWHSDLSYCADPSDALLLYATHVPGDGGDTLIANRYLAYEALPERTKRRIEGRAPLPLRGRGAKGAVTEPDPARRAMYPDVERPLVRTRARTGRKMLYCDPGCTMCVKGLASADSADLPAELHEHVLRPEFPYRHRWAPRQLVGGWKIQTPDLPNGAGIGRSRDHRELGWRAARRGELTR